MNAPMSFEKAAGGARPGERLVVIGNGMVGHRFCERLVEFVDGIAADTPVLVATYGGATAHLSEDALAALNSLGAALNAEDVRGAYFAIAGVKGAAPGTAAQVIDANDAFLRVSLNRDRRALAAAVDSVQIGR